MKSLTYTGKGELSWSHLPAPRIRQPHEAIVAPVAATTCDLDRAMIAGKTPFRGPFALGHECVARVVELGSDEAGLAVGDLVVVPWHVACGSCAPCEAGRPSQCSLTPAYAMFGIPLGGEWGGMFSELLLVPWARTALTPLPEAVSAAAAAAASDSLTDAYSAVRTGLRDRPGQPVLVVGGLTHGLYACAFAVALGSSRVVYADSDARRRRTAESYGAQTVDSAAELDAGAFPVTVDASADPRGLAAGLRATAPGGHCHSVGIYFEPVKLPLMSMYMDAVTLTTGRPDITPHLPAVLSLLASGQVDPLPVYSDTLAYDDLPEALLDLPAKPLVLFG
ncbi:alcohol dehydrogenase catalytic domain-containing protein [Streptomyces sp. NPDC126514]|uniref:zinc-dependent alcohol dehydrogenase n=1 Tax=Streptomyces sp. NPDC126514 TaxID=3155210 RepID=UPI0033195A45